MYNRSKVQRQPVHPILIIFPITFFLATFVSFVGYAITREILWFQVGYIANVAGVITAIMAAIPGFVDWAIGLPTPAMKRTGNAHLVLNLLTLILFALNAWLMSTRYDDALPDGDIAVVLSTLGVGLTTISGYLGWNLNHKRKTDQTNAAAAFYSGPADRQTS